MENKRTIFLLVIFVLGVVANDDRARDAYQKDLYSCLKECSSNKIPQNNQVNQVVNLTKDSFDKDVGLKFDKPHLVMFTKAG